LEIEEETKSASVRRLVRDGVEPPLETLFVDAARLLSPNTEGADRARSATEAFLYRRLHTVGLRCPFSMNVGLPMLFDGSGGMEVDLPCDNPRLVVKSTVRSISATLPV